MPSSAPSAPGNGGLPERIGPFTIHGVLGKGGMGVVFDARTEDGRDVALKVVRPVGDADRAQLLVARFLREAQILEQLDHPGVVRLVDSGSDNGLLYLAMERIEGVSLLTIRRRGPLDFSPLVELGVYLADALEHLHAAGVVHRDIKPANILIGAGGRPVITDFGISGMDDATGITRQGDLLGSPGFMAPEVVDGSNTTPASDQFALGRLLFELGAHGPARRLPKNAPILEMLTAAMEIDWGRFPMDAEWPELRSRLQRMLAKRPEDRFETCKAVTIALRELLDSSDVLDFETLSEHVEKMDLKVTRSWEALADDLALPPSDELMLNLERPAGERATDHFEEATHVPPILPRETSSEGLPAFPAPDRHSADTIPPPPDETRPPSAPGQPPEEMRTAIAALPPSKELPGPAPVADVNPAVPLNTLIARNYDERPPTSGDVDAPFPNPTDAGQTMPPRDSSRGPTPTRQMNRLREELKTSRRRVAEITSSRLRWRIAIVGALAVGVVAGFLAKPVAPALPSLVLVPSDRSNTVLAKYSNRGDTPITEADRRDAAEMLEAAQERLTARDLDGAERLLDLCIQVADLPDCHKTLATILTMTNDPAARAHYLHYLDIAPTAPDAEAIRAILRE